jgi:hypothetical protein
MYTVCQSTSKEVTMPDDTIIGTTSNDGIRITEPLVIAAVLSRVNYPKVESEATASSCPANYWNPLLPGLRLAFGDEVVNAALADLRACAATYRTGTVEGIKAYVSNRKGREAYTDVIFAPGEDRSPVYQSCICYDRYDGGPVLHPSPLAPGPCYLDEDDASGYYPE